MTMQDWGAVLFVVGGFMLGFSFGYQMGRRDGAPKRGSDGRFTKVRLSKVR